MPTKQVKSKKPINKDNKVLKYTARGIKQAEIAEKLSIAPHIPCRIITKIASQALAAAKLDASIPKEMVAKLDLIASANLMPEGYWPAPVPEKKGESVMRFKKKWNLYPMQRQIIIGASKGLSFSDIAAQNFSSLSSITTFASDAYTRMGVDNLVQAVAAARKFTHRVLA